MHVVLLRNISWKCLKAFLCKLAQLPTHDLFYPDRLRCIRHRGCSQRCRISNSCIKRQCLALQELSVIGDEHDGFAVEWHRRSPTGKLISKDVSPLATHLSFLQDPSLSPLLTKLLVLSESPLPVAYIKKISVLLIFNGSGAYIFTIPYFLPGQC